MRECSDCRWCASVTDSIGDNIYFCVDVESGAYLSETGICGNCDLDPFEEED
jgi:hypothetical protein